MQGVKKLTVPWVEQKPRLYHVTIVRDEVQHRYFIVAMSLSEAILGYWYKGRNCYLTEYICHSEITVDDINNKFKNYNPTQI
jgi:hypothetical protein